MADDHPQVVNWPMGIARQRARKLLLVLYLLRLINIDVWEHAWETLHHQ
jgi:hypothetical protein